MKDMGCVGKRSSSAEYISRESTSQGKTAVLIKADKGTLSLSYLSMEG
jgi:hypothetical protein